MSVTSQRDDLEDHADIRDELSRIGLFGGLSDEALAHVAEHAVRSQVAAGEAVFAQGERGCSLFVILSGEVTTTIDGVEIERLGAGDWFGEMAILDVMARPHSAMATQPTELFRVEARHLAAFYRCHMKMYALLMMNIARELSRRLRRMEERVAQAGNSVQTAGASKQRPWTQ